jgi:hypothetical protein
MATLQAALKRGIEMTFQIEESELVAEPLPKQDERKALLFYEAAEGGAGVLTRLATEPGAMAQVAARPAPHAPQDPSGPGRSMDCLRWSKKPPMAAAFAKPVATSACCRTSTSPTTTTSTAATPRPWEMLVALANAQVAASASRAHKPAFDAGHSSSGPGDLFTQLARGPARRHRLPHARQTRPAHGGQLPVAAKYKATRTLVVHRAPPGRSTAAMVDKGLDRARHVRPSHWWAQQFASHAPFNLLIPVPEFADDHRHP